MLRPLITVSAIFVAVSLSGCKQRTALGGSAKDYESDAADSTFKPYDAVQMTARVKAAGPCGAAEAQAWADAGDSAALGASGFAPGMMTISAAAPAALDKALWEIEGYEPGGLTIFSSKAAEANPSLLIAKFAGKDPNGVDWVYGGSFARALESAYAEAVGKGMSRVGLVAARRILSSKKPSVEQPVNSQAAGPEAYAKCGDGLVTREIIARDFPLAVFAKTPVIEDVRLLLVKALGPGSSDQDRKTLKDQVAAGKIMIRAFIQDAGKGVEANEAYDSLIDYYKTNANEGVRTNFYVAAPAPGFDAAPEVKTLNTALKATSTARATILSFPKVGEGLKPALEATEKAIEACGGVRFSPGCKGLAEQAGALDGAVTVAKNPPLSAERMATAWVQPFSQVPSPRNSWVCSKGTKQSSEPESRTLSRTEIEQLWKTTAFRKTVFDAMFSPDANFFNREDNKKRSKGPAFDKAAEYFWLRPKEGGGPSRWVARIQDKRNPESRLKDGKTSAWTDDYPLELSFVEVAKPEGNVAGGLCIFSFPAERGDGIIDENPEP